MRQAPAGACIRRRRRATDNGKELRLEEEKTKLSSADRRQHEPALARRQRSRLIILNHARPPPLQQHTFRLTSSKKKLPPLPVLKIYENTIIFFANKEGGTGSSPTCWVVTRGPEPEPSPAADPPLTFWTQPAMTARSGVGLLYSKVNRSGNPQIRCETAVIQ